MNRYNLKKVYVIALFALMAMGLAITKARGQEAMTLPNPAVTISMDFKDADLKDILKVFSIQSGLNFVASQAVEDRKITLYLDKVPVLDCMDKIFKANNLSYEKEVDSNIIIVKDWGKPSVQTITKVFVLKYNRLSNSRINSEIKNYLDQSSAQGGTGLTQAAGGGGGTASGGKTEDFGITASIKNLLSSYGKITEDVRSNSLVVTDIPSNFGLIEQTIIALDVAVPQVMLEIEMLDVSKNAVDRLGFNYGTTPFTAIISGASRPMNFPWNVTNLGALTSGGIQINPLVDGEGTAAYRISFDFLKTSTDTRYLARPRVLTLSNETAEIKIVANEAIGVQSETGVTSEVVSGQAERTETGVMLRITPQVNTITGEITMFVMPLVADASSEKSEFQSGSQKFSFLNPESRGTKSVVRVKDGDTIVIGGLIRNVRSESRNQLPFFGSIPVVGLLFKGKTVNPNRERELLIFITPRIVKEGQAVASSVANNGVKKIAEADAQRYTLISDTLKEQEKK